MDGRLPFLVEVSPGWGVHREKGEALFRKSAIASAEKGGKERGVHGGGA